MSLTVGTKKRMKEELRSELIAHGVALDEALERCMESEKLYETLLGMFLTDENFEGLRQAVERGDVERAYRCAHTLKGVSGNIGFTPLFELLVPMVEHLRGGVFPATMTSDMALLFRRYDALCAMLRDYLK